MHAGVPHTPVMPIVEYRGKRDVAVTVQTFISGLPQEGGNFYFILDLILTELMSESQFRMDVENYNNEDSVIFEFEELGNGNYTVEVVAGNDYGVSEKSPAAMFLVCK